tara:strand:- start:1149 stop:2303 length:1155 start_codon:yes stop_codon:yes gene_type:complete
MNNFDAIIDVGSKNLKLGVFNKTNNSIYSSKQKIIDSLEKSLNILIRDAEKYLSSHIDNVVVLYDSPKFYTLDISIKKVFDHATSIKKVYNSLIEEALFLISQNNFKDQVIHLLINNIITDENKTLEKISDDIKIKSLILEIKFICLSKILIENISNKFKKNNLKILNLYCSSYVKTISYKKNFSITDSLFFLDIGFERTSGFIFKNGKLELFKSIPLGGNNITKDISKVLQLDFDYSEDLKIKFNKLENDKFFSKNDLNQTNLYSEILEKNISGDLLKEVIEARIDEIINLVVFQKKSIKQIDPLLKTKLILIGGGAKLLLNNYNLRIKKLISEIISYNEEDDSFICQAGLDYNMSEESFIIKTKKKPNKYGFFEKFFNLFSK